MPTRKPKTQADVRSLARGHTASAIRVLAGIMTSEKAAGTARIAAAVALLDRGWGKPTQSFSGDEDGPLISTADRTSHRLLEQLRAEIAAGPEALLNGKSEKGAATT